MLGFLVRLITLSFQTILSFQKSLVMRMRIAYKVDGKDKLEEGQINNFPRGLWGQMIRGDCGDAWDPLLFPHFMLTGVVQSFIPSWQGRYGSISIGTTFLLKLKIGLVGWLASHIWFTFVFVFPFPFFF